MPLGSASPTAGPASPPWPTESLPAVEAASSADPTPCGAWSAAASACGPPPAMSPVGGPPAATLPVAAGRPGSASSGTCVCCWEPADELPAPAGTVMVGPCPLDAAANPASTLDP